MEKQGKSWEKDLLLQSLGIDKKVRSALNTSSALCQGMEHPAFLGDVALLSLSAVASQPLGFSECLEVNGGVSVEPQRTSTLSPM